MMTDPMPLEPSIADVHPEDTNADPIDGTKPAMPAHATVDDFSSGAPVPQVLPMGPSYPPMSQMEAEAEAILPILQGILSNMSTDPAAVEKNTSLAVQYLDTLKKKARERVEERNKEELAEMMKNPPVIEVVGSSPPSQYGDYLQVNDKHQQEL